MKEMKKTCRKLPMVICGVLITIFAFKNGGIVPN